MRPLLLLLLPAGLAAQQAAPSPSPVKLGGYLQSRLTWQKDVGLTASLNRARLQATGSVGNGFSYRIQAEFRTGNVGNGKASASLTDAYIRWSREAFGVQVGQMKTPFSREYLTSTADIETLDRSTAVDSLATKRDIGLQADYQAGKYVTLTAGAFNGEGQNVTTNRDSTVLGVARVAVRPVPEVTLGANAARWFGDSTRYGADLSVEVARFVARAEVVAQARESLGGKRDRGWYALAGFKVSPAVQLVGKYEDFQRRAISTQQDNMAWSAGLNWWPVPTAVRLSGFYVSRKVGDPGVRKGLVQAQLQARF